jgi:hypothetical protein
MRVRRIAGVLGAALFALSACSPDGPPTSPEPADVLANIIPPCPVGGLCGSTNGVIHDGTRSGTLVSVPGDPSPGAPGVWLGDTLSGRWCYADYNSFITDADRDWLDDDCEFQLAKAFAPQLHMDPHEPCPQGEPYWAAKYFDDPGTGWGEFVRIAYLPSYYRDCGTSNPHTGDSEMMMIAIRHNPSTRHWEFYQAWMSAHTGTPNAAPEYVTDASTMEYPIRPLTYPRVWIAWRKHGFYRNQHECFHRAPLDGDDCTFNEAAGRMLIYSNRNVGGRSLNRFPNGVASANPLYAQNGRKEFYYSQSRFNGWQTTGDGGSPYFNMLHSFRFECFDFTYNFAGSPCYVGGGAIPPASSTTLLGAVNGPISVNTGQSYTWTSFVTGGQIPYRAEWHRKYASSSTATLVGNSTGTWSATNSTAGALTITIDRCESFTLTLKVWSQDNQMKTDNHAVAIGSCPPPPPPPLTVSISGPSSISVKATYTYTAVTSGFSSQSYAWSQRYCTATSCPGWTNLTGYTTSVPRVLTFNSTCTGETRYEIRVTVRNSDGRTVTATKQTALCAGGGGLEL